MLRFEKTALDMVNIPRGAVLQILDGPTGCANVYLFGLIGNGGSVDEIARELGLTKRVVLMALEYLQEKGLIMVTGEAISYKAALPNGVYDEAVYEDSMYNALLQRMFSDRELTYLDYKAIYECHSIFNLPKDVVLILVEACIATHKSRSRVPSSYIRDMARIWAKEGISTIEQAEQKKFVMQGANDSAAEVLRMLGIGRLPSDEEVRLYEKWTRNWGFSFGAVKAALAATTGVQYPTMKYLDGILRNMRNKGKLTGEELKQHLDDTQDIDNYIKELLSRLPSLRQTVSPDYRLKYMEWREMGFTQGALEQACSRAASAGHGNFDCVDKILFEWRDLKIFTEEQITNYKEIRRKLEASVAEVMAIAGVNRRPTRADEQAYVKYIETYSMPHELVVYGAERAYGTNAPMKYLDKLMRIWFEAGINTLKEAQKEYGVRVRPVTKRATAGEREYTQEDLDNIFGDPLAAGGGNEG